MQKNPATTRLLCVRELEKYIGILVMSSVVHCTSVRDLWKPILVKEVVKNCMSINKFEFIRSILHFNNSKMKAPNDPDRDRLFKIRPIVGHQNERFSSIPMRYLCRYVLQKQGTIRDSTIP